MKKERQAPRDLSVPPVDVRFVVDDAHAGARLDRYLIERLPWRSRTTIVQLVEDGDVSVQGVRATRKAQRLRPGDAIVVRVPPPEEEVRHEELAASLVILHEDDALIAIAKPAGLVVHPVGKVRVNTLIQALHWRFREGGHVAGLRTPPPKICHRLDRDTSGVILVAKDDRARARIQEVFERRDVEKEYLAVVHGVIGDDAGLIDRPIGPDPRGRIRQSMTVRPDGDPSRTRFRVLERLGDASVVRFDLETGRQHQIRVHAASLGHPVVLDPIYGPWEPGASLPEEGAPVIARQALHARRLALAHPMTGERLELLAPPPVDLVALIEWLRTPARPTLPHPN